MRRAAVFLALILSAWLSQTSRALAASDVELKHATDGTLVVVGSGWHHGQSLVIDVGPQKFNVRADASGDFELATGLAASSGELSVHHPAAAPNLSLAAVEPTVPNPFAVLFAWSVAFGIVLLGATAGSVLLLTGVLRRMRPSRYPRE